MYFKFKNGEKVEESTGLLISILLRYPEISSINLNPDTQFLKFTYIVSKELKNNEEIELESNFLEAVETYNYLKKQNIINFNFRNYYWSGVTVIELERDLQSITKEEISLHIELLKHYCDMYLATDENPKMFDEELEQQDDLICNMLEKIRDTKIDKALIAVRDEGKVLVFNP